MTELKIRDAVPKDCQTIIDMIVELAVYEKEPASRVQITKETLIRDGFSNNDGKKWFRCLVAEAEADDAKIIIGYALFFPTYSTWNGRTIKLEDLYIQPAYRGKGYGTRLLQRVNEIALSEGCIRLHWCVLDWNEPAIDFYKAIGAEYSKEWRVCMLHYPEMKAFESK